MYFILKQGADDRPFHVGHYSMIFLGSTDLLSAVISKQVPSLQISFISSGYPFTELLDICGNFRRMSHPSACQRQTSAR
jgi:hypothetical protein